MTNHDAGDPSAYAAEELWAIGRLISGVVHEINNPLTSAGGLADLLQSEIEDESARDDLLTIAGEVTRAVRIVRNLRAFAAQAEDPHRLCSLDRLVTLVVDTRGYEARGRGIDLTHELGDADRPILAVPAKILLLTLMLVLRAEQSVLATRDEDGAVCRIVLRTSSTREAVTLSVEDNGSIAATETDRTVIAAAAAAAEFQGTLHAESLSEGGARISVTFPSVRET